MGSGKEMERSQSKRLSRKFRQTADFLKTYEQGEHVQGWLKKRGNSGLWHKRWFVLHDRFLTFLKKEPKSTSDFEKAIGSINMWTVEQVWLEDCEITLRFSKPGPVSTNKLSRTTSSFARMLSIHPDQMVLRANDSDTAQRWVQAMSAIALNDHSREAFNAEGSLISNFAPEARFRSDPELKIDMADSSIRRDDELDVHSFQITSGESKSKKPLFTSKRLFGFSRLYVGILPPTARIAVQLSRRSKNVGTITSEQLELYEMKDDLIGTHFCVVLVDEKISKDGVKLIFERDPWHAIRHLLGGSHLTATVGVSLSSLILLAFLLKPFVGLLVWTVLSGVALVGLFALNKDSAVLTAVQVIPMHEARMVLNKLSRRSKRAAKKFAVDGAVPELAGEDEVEEDDMTLEEVGDGPELSAKEQKLLKQLHAAVKDLLETKDKAALKVYHKYLDNDWRLVRFLRARNLSVKKAEVLLRKALTWRVEYDAENIHNNYTPADWVLDYFGCEQILNLLRSKEDRLGWYFRDHKGSLGVFVRAGALNHRKVYRKLGNDGEKFFELGVWLFQMIQNDLDAHYTKNHGSVSSQISIVVDLDGFQMSNQIPIDQALGLARKYLPKLLDAYPEVLGRVIVINAPWLFHSIWSLFTPILPERVISKISILGSNKRKLEERISTLFLASQTPVAYGGSYIEDDEDPYCPRRVPCQGPFSSDKGASLIDNPKKKK